jgi:hypothetical protein
MSNGTPLLVRLIGSARGTVEERRLSGADGCNTDDRHVKSVDPRPVLDERICPHRKPSSVKRTCPGREASSAKVLSQPARILSLGYGAEVSKGRCADKQKVPVTGRLPSCVFHCNQRLTMLFYNSQEGPLLYQRRSPSIDIAMSDGDICAPKGPQAHTMSPPLLG